jgi:hypothetical protein
MKKVILLIVGVALLLFLSFMPNNTIEDEITTENDKDYLTLVPVKPPASPPKK